MHVTRKSRETRLVRARDDRGPPDVTKLTRPSVLLFAFFLRPSASQRGRTEWSGHETRGACSSPVNGELGRQRVHGREWSTGSMDAFLVRSSVGRRVSCEERYACGGQKSRDEGRSGSRSAVVIEAPRTNEARCRCHVPQAPVQQGPIQKIRE